MTAPSKTLLRRGEVQDWLEQEGITRAASRKLMDDEVIKGAPLYKGGRDYYRTEQIQRDVLKQPLLAEGPASVAAEQRKKEP